VSPLFWRRGGRGPAVVLLHGGFLDHRVWADAHDALSAGYDVVSVDFRGAGQSSREPTPHSPSQDLIDLLDELGLTRGALVGCSMGARAALEVAALRPERVRALVACSLALPEFVDSDCDGQLPEFVRAATTGDWVRAKELFTRMWFDGRRDPATVDARARERFEELIDLGFAATYPHQRWLTLDELGPVERIATPTRFVTGEADWPDIHRTAAALAARLPSADVVSLDGAAHTPNLDRPREWLDRVQGFLATHP
jgi:pimeloyl-ACP methyl ester carboxylesterase